MKFRKRLILAIVLIVGAWIALTPSAHARKRRGYRGPQPTHPVILWSRTVQESKDPEQRKVAAFKLSQYSQPIFQPSVVTTLLACSKDADVQIKVLCTKALGGVRSASQNDPIRDSLLKQFDAEPLLRNTIVRTFIARKEESPPVHKRLLDALEKSSDTEEILVLLSYFEAFDNPSKDISENLVNLYNQKQDIKIRRSTVRVLTAKAKGQDSVVALLAGCAQARDTPLALNCLSGLQAQAKKDARAWEAVQNTIQSRDPDVLLASLDLINALPDTKNAAISRRLLDLMDDADDADIQEKAILALGVCGDQSEATVKALEKVFSHKKTEEASRIAAALTLGKQAVVFPSAPRELLSECVKGGATQSLRSACQLGLNELGPETKPAAETATTADKKDT